jgi:outer membrane receptor protein involved in Fe transport
LSLLSSTGFQYNTFKSYWQKNNYLAHRVVQRPSESDFSIQLKGDVAITEQIKFRGSYGRQWMKETFYWQPDTTTGLFTLYPIANTKLSEIEIGIVAELSDKTRLQASYIDYADNVPESADTMQQNASINRLPYRPDFRLPMRASIQLLPQMNLALTADVVGKRRKTLHLKDTLPTFALFHVDVKYDVHENITALLSVRNLLDAKYSVWDGYPETGIVVLVGARARF